MTFEQLRDMMVQGGVPLDLANQLAAKQVATMAAQLAAEQARINEEAKRKADEAAGIVEWNGLRLSNFRERPSPYCTCHSSGLAVEPAGKGKGSDGETAYFPPKLWVARKGHKLVKLTQNDCAALLAVIEHEGTEKAIEILKTIGSSDAVETYRTEEARLASIGEIANRNGKSGKGKAKVKA